MGEPHESSSCMYEDDDTDSDYDHTVPDTWTKPNRRGVREAFKDCYPMFCTPVHTAPCNKGHKHFYCPCNKHMKPWKDSLLLSLPTCGNGPFDMHGLLNHLKDGKDVFHMVAFKMRLYLMIATTAREDIGFAN